MTKRYDKLIRDRIPEILEQGGVRFETTVLTEAEFDTALRAKLVEEATEAAAAARQDLLGELADIFEVLDALMQLTGIDLDAVVGEQERKRVERGGFKKRLLLNWTE